MDVSRDIGIGGRVRAARERVGLSREALAYHSGISWSAIAQVESGRRTNVRPATLAALAKPLRVTIDYLVAGQGSSTVMAEHRALLYETEAEFLATAVPFLADGVDRSEAPLAVTSEPNMEALRRELGARADRVQFADRGAWYATPGTALLAYRSFIDQSTEAGAAWVRILGEPVRSGDSDTDRLVWARYESLLNIVFGSAPVSVLCGYDTRATPSDFIEHVRATHPEIVEQATLSSSGHYVTPAAFVLTH